LKSTPPSSESEFTSEDSGSDYVPSVALMAHADDTPKKFEEAMKSEDAVKWKAATDDEMLAHSANGTWRLVDLPKDRRAIGCRWVFFKKDDGRYKARLVVQGFSQVEGVEYQETFSPVIRSESIKLLMAVAASQNKEVHQMDFTTAFLNGTIEGEIYMKQPVGYEDEANPDKVCRLVKSLYGLKQVPLCWNNEIDQVEES
jgi:hypothetical protein